MNICFKITKNAVAELNNFTFYEGTSFFNTQNATQTQWVDTGRLLHYTG